MCIGQELTLVGALLVMLTGLLFGAGFALGSRIINKVV